VSSARHLKVIVFSDIFDSSAQIFADELIAIQHIKQDLALIREAVQRHDGCLVKSLGDGILATFDAPTQALEFIRGVIRCLHDRGHRSLQHRFGMHTGEIYADGDDILGQGVHLASRLQTVSPPNGVAFVQSTYELVAPEFRRHAECLGATPLKGLPGPMICYCLREEALLDSAPAVEPPHDAEEDLLEQAGYQRLRLLGQSPNRKTELVRNRRRDRLAVLKTFRAAPEMIDSLRLEAARLDRLRHPRIPRFLDEIVGPDRYLFIQEYIPGASLQGSMDVLRRKQRLAHVLRQMLEVLELVHNAGLVHGDINPGNLIPAREGDDMFLVDFALVRARTEAHGAQPGSQDAATAEGTEGPAAVADPPLGATPLGVDVTARPFYSPPERARFGRLWPGGDLYSLGVTALSLYCGRPPEELYDQSLSSWRFHDLDREVVAWLAPLLEESPGRRLPRAADVLQLLDRPQPVAPPARSRVSGQAHAGEPGLPALQRETLARRLTDTYGLVVDLLLESWPSTIAPGQRRALRERLLSSGLRADDIDAAFAAAAVVPEAAAGPAPSPSAAPTAAAEGDLHQVRAWFVAQIGPIAEMLWNADLEAVLRRDPAAAAASLEQVGVPDGVIRELLQRVGRRPPSGSPAAPAAPGAAGPSQESRPAPTAIAAAGEALRQAMVSLVGPIGDHLFEQEVSPRPAPEQLAAALAVFRRLGLDPALGEELRRRWEG
jgi:class 3 adenylate cyclase/serine/threonine protein kinase